MNRRTLLMRLGTVGAVGSLAGCADVLSCGPSEPSFERIESNPGEYVGTTVDVDATVESMDDAGFYLLVDDGTATAHLSAPYQYAYDTEIIDEGECHIDSGTVADQENWRDVDADIYVNAAPPEN